MVKRIVIVLVALAVLAIVCLAVWTNWANRLESGYIIGKRHEPAHTIYITQYMYIGKSLIPMIRPRHIPDRWYITVENGDKTDEWQVSSEEYGRLNIGDWAERG